jgi:hypothetical protein
MSDYATLLERIHPRTTLAVGSRGSGMTPQQVVIDVFGGIRAVARVVDVAPSTVLRWGIPRKRSGNGGLIPSMYHQALLSAALEQGKRLTEEHLRIGKPGIQSRIIRRL